MKPTDIDDDDAEIQFMITRANTFGCRTADMDTPERLAEVREYVDRLNEFYAEHGRMPSSSELDVISKTNDKDNGPVELTYELDE